MESSTTKAWLLEVLAELSNAQRQKFLTFVTGSSSLPPSAPVDYVSVNRQMRPASAFPEAHTCFRSLDLLLEYPSKEELRQRLLFAFEEGCRYGMA